MKVLRLALVSALLLLVSAPLFALPQCSKCNTATFDCELSSDPTSLCNPFTCADEPKRCSPAESPVLATELVVASVEVVTPQEKTVTTNEHTVRVAAVHPR